MAETMTIDKEEFNRVRGEVHNLAVSQDATEAQMVDAANESGHEEQRSVTTGGDSHYGCRLAA